MRSSQDWSEVTDPRLFRTCHVTNHGSGVLLAQQPDALTILANAHVVGDADRVTVHLPAPGTRADTSREARVFAKAHEGKVDLALLVVEPPPGGEEFSLRLADPLEPGERRSPVELMVLSEADRPFPFSAHLVERTLDWGGDPDDWGATVYEKPMACVYGGVRQANSGTPVFDGDRRVGLVEIHPLRATVANENGEAEEVVGIGVSVPSRIRRFLSAHHSLALVGE